MVRPTNEHTFMHVWSEYASHALVVLLCEDRGSFHTQLWIKCAGGFSTGRRKRGLVKFLLFG